MTHARFDRLWPALAAATAAVIVPHAAHAQRKVSLNGVDLANVEVKSLSLSNCGVRFDDAGNVFITCKGVDIKTAPTTGPRVADDVPARPASGALTRRYFLVAKPTVKNAAPTPYKVSVYVGKKLVALVEPSKELFVLEVSSHLRPGDNAVRLVAARVLADASRAPSSAVEIIIGEGVVRKGTVVIQRPLITYRRNASETRSFDDTFKLSAR